jgi:hypothetical protein
MKKFRKPLLITGGILAVILLAAGLVYRLAGTYTVTYRVSGPAGAAQVNYIAFYLPGGLAAAEEQVSLPWQATRISDRLVYRPAASLRVLAADRSAPLTCEIWVDGQQVDRKQAAGAVGCLFDLPAKK